MEIIYLLIPISLVFVGVILWAFLWAVGSGQFDDLEGPAHQILMDDDDVPPAVSGDRQAEGEEAPRRPPEPSSHGRVRRGPHASPP
ncbi:MAG: cbb3-type cytochrome oxidase assembly protein CcoS [Gammaproteobacteria bacterium]